MNGTPIVCVVRDANPAPRHLGAGNWFQQNTRFAGVQLTDLDCFVVGLSLPGGCAGLHPLYSSVGYLCQPVTLEDGASLVTVLRWHPLACSFV
jgi:hypothetical protein